MTDKKMMTLDTKKATRREAYELIKQLRSQPTDGLTAEEINSLLLFFAPQIPKKAKTVEQWVAKAVADKKESREYMRYLYVKDGVLMATDGRRIHKTETTWDDGYYCPHTFESVECSYRFPNIDVFFGTRIDKSIDLSHINMEKGIKQVWGKPLAYLEIEEVGRVNENYLLDATNGSLDTWVDIAESRLMGESNFGQWVVVQMKPE